MTTLSPVISFDFDGVIAHTKGFVSKEHEGEPNLEVVKAIRMLKEQGCKILIHSTRGNEFLKNYCEKFSIPVDYINHNPNKEGDNPGKPIAFVYVDDRSICYRGETAEELVSEIASFKAHWEK
jgi:hydroxymethylpyrimidine pyrophosphatase-like HAD family hydrolase